ncbi:MAG: NAD(P)H-binding protein [Tessaracoccus sp.]
MYTITGVTGHVGAIVAKELLDRGKTVRAVLRDPVKRAHWDQQGAQSLLADFTDTQNLAEALRGSDGVFAMLPVLPSLDEAGHRRLVDSIAGAIEASGVGHVVLLSSIGADLPGGTGPIRWLHELEQRLAGTDAVVTAIRPCHFQEKVETVLDAVLHGGIYPVFADSADAPEPMIATRDVGRAAAEALLACPSVGESIDLIGPAYTERDVVDRLSAILHRPIEVVTIPRNGWVDAMVAADVPAAFAKELAELYAAGEDGLLRPRGDRRQAHSTPIEETLHQVIETRTSAHLSMR